MSNIKLFKNAHILNPQDTGVLDLLVAGQQIAALGENLDIGNSNLPVEVIDASDCYLVPGFVDS